MILTWAAACLQLFQCVSYKHNRYTAHIKKQHSVNKFVTVNLYCFQFFTEVERQQIPFDFDYLNSPLGRHMHRLRFLPTCSCEDVDQWGLSTFCFAKLRPPWPLRVCATPGNLILVTDIYVHFSPIPQNHTHIQQYHLTIDFIDKISRTNMCQAPTVHGNNLLYARSLCKL